MLCWRADQLAGSDTRKPPDCGDRCTSTRDALEGEVVALSGSDVWATFAVVVVTSPRDVVVVTRPVDDGETAAVGRDVPL